ncbi:hypothetical protein BH11CYA1_BH11CYA1_24790 [soil metagenome]
MICPKCEYRLASEWICCPKCGLAIAPESRIEDPKETKYGAGVRAQVLEVIVRQAIAGAPWKEICYGPMEVNNISIEEVEEILRRRGQGGSFSASVLKKPKTPSGTGNLANATPGKKLNLIATALTSLLKIMPNADSKDLIAGEQIVAEIKAVESELEAANQSAWYQVSEASLQSDLERELAKRPPHNPQSGGSNPFT